MSVFEKDTEAFELWRDVIGVPVERIQRMGEKDNFWAAGPTGPCGPCSELYFDFHPERGTQGASLEDDSRFIEFYNLVFMESNRGSDGVLTPLANRNIDTGMGLERMAQILQGVPNNYETDLIFPIVQRAAQARLPAPRCAALTLSMQLAGLDYASADETTKTRLKVVGDHARAVTYLISDGVLPSNIGRGYIVRRLIRRAVRNGRLLGISGETAFMPLVSEVAISLSGACDPQVAKNAGAHLNPHPLLAAALNGCDRAHLQRAETRGDALRPDAREGRGLARRAAGKSRERSEWRAEGAFSRLALSACSLCLLSLLALSLLGLAAAPQRRASLHVVRHLRLPAGDHAGGCCRARRGG